MHLEQKRFNKELAEARSGGEGSWLSLVFATLLILLGGCGGSDLLYTKQGITLEQWNKDLFECKVGSPRPYLLGLNGMLVVGSEKGLGKRHDCIVARGYTTVDRDVYQKDSENSRAITNELARLETEGARLNAAKRVLDQWKAALDGEEDGLWHRMRLGSYNAEVAKHNKQAADHSQHMKEVTHEALKQSEAAQQ